MRRKVRGRGWRQVLGLGAVLAGSAILWLGCENNLLTPPLPPTGGIDNSCISDYDVIQVVGDFTEPAWNIPVSPAMVLGPGCVWSTLVKIGSPGDHTFKFVTNGAFDNPKDFGWNESQTLRVGVDNPVLLVSGTGTGIKLNIPVAGCYLIRLYEQDLYFRADPTSCASGGVRGTVAFENADQPPFPQVRVTAEQDAVAAGSDSSEAADGSYEISGLAAGSYDLVFKAFGYLDTTLTGVQVGETVVEVPAVRLRPGCVSAYDSIYVAGQFTTPPFDLSVSPVMTQVSGCQWEATVNIPRADTYLFKFVTGPGFDNPTDYGGDEAITVPIDSTFAVREVSGTGTAIKLYVPFPGDFLFELDEETRTFRVESGGIAGDLGGVLVFAGHTGQPLPVAALELLDGAAIVARTTSAAEDGVFKFSSVDAGIYDLEVVPPLAAPTHLDTTLAAITVAGGTTNVGQIFLAQAPGALAGTVSFSDVAAAPYPVAAIVVRQGSVLAESLVTTSSAAGFAVTGLKPASYDVRVSAPGYLDSTFSVSVSRSTVLLGAIPLQALICSAYPTITRLQLGGREVTGNPDDLTFSWNLNRAPVLEHLTLCGWSVSVTCPNIADYRVKFIANGDFGGDPPDFGGDNTTLVPADSTVTVLPVATPSTGEAILIRIDNPGIYRFDLDLGGMTCRYTRTGDLPPVLRRQAARKPRAH